MNLLDLTTMLWVILTLAAIVAAIWLIITFSRIDERLRRTLEQRLSRGEITMDEYRARVALLS
ncbi:MAG TPA: hypothetical protein VI814_04700 [Candidatus Limnocylindria bacterium]